MHILSLADIQLIVNLFETQRDLSDVRGRERQVDSLIRTGYLRPLHGSYVLTELGQKTARSLQARQFVPTRALPAGGEPTAGTHPEPPALASDGN